MFTRSPDITGGRRRLVLLTSALAVVAAPFAASAFASTSALPPASVVADGTFVQDGTGFEFSFQATASTDGGGSDLQGSASGTFNAWGWGASYSGPVTCFAASGNTATVVFANTDPSTASSQPYIKFDFTDNGATGDKATFWFFTAAGSPCSANGGLYAVTSGGVTITDTVAAVNQAPSVSVTGVTDGASYEHDALPAAGCSATDAEDGPSSPTVSLSAVTGPLAADGVGSQTASCSVTDSGGLTGTASATYTIYDTTKPVLSGLPGAQTATATSSTGAPVTWTAPTATDTADPAPAVICNHRSGDTYLLGTTTVSCYAQDASGNKSPTQSFTVNVTYAWSGLLQPINADGSSVFKAGSTVPVKFALTGGSAGVANATATLTSLKRSASVAGTSTEAIVTSTATTGSLFRYDSTSGQYIFNWSTKGLTTGTYDVTVNLGDGAGHTTTVSLK